MPHSSPPPALTNPQDRVCAAQTADFAVLDDPQEWVAFGKPFNDSTPDSATWQSQVTVQGMHCAACALTVERAMTALPGVIQAQVNAATGRAQVVWRSGQIKPSDWMGAVRAAGYGILPANDASLVDQRKTEERRALWRWLVAALCMMQVMMYAYPTYSALPGDMSTDSLHLMHWAGWVLTLPLLFFSCWPFFESAWRDLTHRSISMDLPVALGLLVTFGVSTAATFDPNGVFGDEVYFDSMSMFVFFLLSARWLEQRLKNRTAGALDVLMNRLPESVERRGQNGEPNQRVALRELRVGDEVRVLPGEAFPADGEVLSGDTWADEALLTGESAPVHYAPGASTTSGAHNLQSAVWIRVLRLGKDTRLAAIVDLMSQAALEKPRLAQLADRVATPFLWLVLLAAFFAAVFGWRVSPNHGLMVAVSVLIVTCPCALSLATPVAMLAAAGRLARGGVLVQHLQALETLAGVDRVVFDKTGTLTQDALRIDQTWVRQGVTPPQALWAGAALAAHSLHPLSRALVRAGELQNSPSKHPLVNILAQNSDAASPASSGSSGSKMERNDVWAPMEIKEVSETAGQGLSAAGGWRLGSAAWCGVDLSPGSAAGGPVAPGRHRVYLSDAQGWLATFEGAELLRPDAQAAVQALQALGLSVALLSGDRPEAAKEVAAELGIAPDLAFGGCTPEDKLTQLQAWQKAGHRTLMVGDGFNDGPVLAGAQVSMAFGEAVPIARTRSDMVLLSAQLLQVPKTIQLARRTLRVVKQNLIWAALYNALCVPMAILGYLPAWLAGLGMATSSLVVVLNAARLSWSGRAENPVVL